MIYAHRMDSLAPSAPTTPNWSPRLPGWALPRGRVLDEANAASAAGMALKSLDDLMNAAPAWLENRPANSSTGVRIFGPMRRQLGIAMDGQKAYFVGGRTERLRTWPDRIGEKIDPFRVPACPAGVNRQQRRVMERQASGSDIEMNRRR